MKKKVDSSLDLLYYLNHKNISAIDNLLDLQDKWIIQLLYFGRNGPDSENENIVPQKGYVAIELAPYFYSAYAVDELKDSILDRSQGVYSILESYEAKLVLKDSQPLTVGTSMFERLLV